MEDFNLDLFTNNVVEKLTFSLQSLINNTFKTLLYCYFIRLLNIMVRNLMVCRLEIIINIANIS